MNALNQNLLADHLKIQAQRWSRALQATEFDAVLVSAGRPELYLFDDQAPPFRSNPHFALWYPDTHSEDACLLFRPGHRPRLYILQRADYWTLNKAPPEWAEQHFDLLTFSTEAARDAQLRRDASTPGRIALIGSSDWPELNAPVNPAPLLAQVTWWRAQKTAFEVACLEAASQAAVAGHLAAGAAFFAGGSELDLLNAFLAGSRQTMAEAPYPPIVGLNEHAATLHYQYYDRSPPARPISFLIDAGARHCGYGSDITRTWAAPGESGFADLIDCLDAEQQALLDGIRPGQNYAELHLAMHARISHILKRFEWVRCSADSALELGLTRTFMPHGLGHLLGLQVHDVGGWQQEADGAETPPPEHHETLRCTRTLKPGMVFTIEPGIYFIPMLLEALREEPAGAEIDWPAVEACLPWGGVRIEDNVLVGDSGVRNLTRDAFNQAHADGQDARM